MARQPRFVLPGHPQHVIQRGNNRQAVFNAEDDYRFYLDRLTECARKFDVAVHAYVLMTNHVHLLMTPATENGISKVMQSLGRYYVQYFNYSYCRTGTLWEGRYKSSLLDSEQYLLTCYRYVELNPVRAGMVKHPSEYPWSSYHFNALGQADALIKPHELYMSLDRKAEYRQAAYRSLFRSHISDGVLEEIRESTNKAWVLGNDRFNSEIEENLNRQVSPKARGGDRRSKDYLARCQINRV